MGFTPLEGLVMATRSGSVDPGMLPWLMEHERLSPAELADALEHRSGLLALAGTGDMREVVAAAAAGDGAARLALAVYVHRLRGAIAAMAAAIGGLEVLVFTGGVGEGSAEVRAAAAAGLAFLGVGLDEQRNAGARADCEIGAAGASVRTLVVRAREDIALARGARAVLEGPPDPRRAARAVAWWRCPTTASPPSRSRRRSRGRSQTRSRSRSPSRPRPTAATPTRRCRATSAAGRWRPAPDGRGMPEHADAPPPPTAARLLVVRARAARPQLAVGAALRQPEQGEQRVTVPFSPYFLEQVKAGQVKSISSKGDTVEGTFTVKLRYPPSDKKATPTKLFATEVPTFWNGSQLSALLQEKDVQINAKSTILETVAAGRAAARLRPDAADRRAVRAARQTRRRGGRRDGRARRLRPLAARAASTPRRSA